MEEKRRKRRGRGEGSVFYDRARRCWVASVSRGKDPESGRRLRDTVYGATKGEVLRNLKAVAEAPARPADAGKRTVSDLMERWLKESRRAASQAVVEARESNSRLHILPRLGHARLSRLTSEDIREFYDELRDSGLAPRTAHDVAAQFAAALRLAVELRYVADSPAAGIRLPKVPLREMLFLTPDQAKLLLAASLRRWAYPLLALALGSGCRQGEMLGLAWDDLDLGESPSLHVRRSLCWTKAHGFRLKEPKTHAGRRNVALPDFAADAMRQHHGAAKELGRLDRPVFAADSGAHRHRSDVRKSLLSAVEAANRASPASIPPGLRFHDLRHTHASILLSQGLSVQAVASRLGHKDPAVTLRWYAHVMPGDDARLAAAIGAALR